MSDIKSRGQSGGPINYSALEWVKGYTAWVLLLPLYLFAWAYSAFVGKIPVRKLLKAHVRYTESRRPDVRIPGDMSVDPYMLRWWRIERNAFFNCYWHIVYRSDDDRALHDHPWWSISIVLSGGYFEHTILPGGVHRMVWHGPGSFRFRRAGTIAHRLQLASTGGVINGTRETEHPARTIFITGPVLRRWGFHATKQWVDAYDWDEYCNTNGLGGMKMAGYADQLKQGG